MKELTAKQRAKIYREAAIGIFKGTYNACCQAVYWSSELPKEVEMGESLSGVLFREFQGELYLFKQRGRTWWWDIDDKDSRITALLLCEQMALNP